MMIRSFGKVQNKKSFASFILLPNNDDYFRNTMNRWILLHFISENKFSFASISFEKLS